MPFDLIFRYFAFVAFGVNLLNLWVMREKLTPAGKVFLTVFASMFLVWGILQFIGGYSTFFFVLLPPLQHPLVILFWFLYFAFLWGTTDWVVWGSGADELAQSGLVRGRNMQAPQSIKVLFITASIIFPMLLVMGHALGVFNGLRKELEQLLAFGLLGSYIG